jgi:hypothetical protein
MGCRRSPFVRHQDSTIGEQNRAVNSAVHGVKHRWLIGEQLPRSGTTFVGMRAMQHFVEE